LQHARPQDRRQYPRFAARLRVWCEGDNVTIYARVGDLSEGGLFVWTSTPLPEGSRAKVRFVNGHTVEAEAVVVWSRAEEKGKPAGMGLQFETLGSEVLESIREIIDGEKAQLRAQS
jgi:uncharacterized protein (TIGR02266 family)